MAQIEIIGNAGDEAELKFINGAKGDFAIAKFSLAETPREFKNGEWHQAPTVWWKVTATGELAEWLADTPLKGIKLVVKGDLRHYEFTDKEGALKTGMEVKAKMIAVVGTLKRKSTKPVEEDISW
jgi:single-strand DNA-binding protein